jgi:hypothetical protein
LETLPNNVSVGSSPFLLDKVLVANQTHHLRVFLLYIMEKENFIVDNSVILLQHHIAPQLLIKRGKH